MSYLRKRDEAEQEVQAMRTRILDDWREKVRNLDWDYVREQITANGSYPLGCLNEILTQVIKPEGDDLIFFKKEPGGTLAATSLLVDQVATEQGLVCRIDDRYKAVLTAQPEEILTQEAPAP